MVFVHVGRSQTFAPNILPSHLRISRFLSSSKTPKSLDQTPLTRLKIAPKTLLRYRYSPNSNHAIQLKRIIEEDEIRWKSNIQVSESTSTNWPNRTLGNTFWTCQRVLLLLQVNFVVFVDIILVVARESTHS